jgi:hypothetical protein
VATYQQRIADVQVGDGRVQCLGDLRHQALNVELIDVLVEDAALRGALGRAPQLDPHLHRDLLVEVHAHQIQVNRRAVQVVVLHRLDQILGRLLVQVHPQHAGTVSQLDLHLMGR